MYFCEIQRFCTLDYLHEIFVLLWKFLHLGQFKLDYEQMNSFNFFAGLLKYLCDSLAQNTLVYEITILSNFSESFHIGNPNILGLGSLMS